MKTDPKMDAFETCLKQVLAGSSPEQALEGYPQWAGELRPMLEAARAAHQAGAGVHMSRAAQARSLARFLEAAARRSHPRFNLFSLFPLHFGLVTVILLMGLVFGGASTVAAAAQALPGDRLYPVKRLTEQGRLLLIQNPAHRIELEQRFDRERLAEVDALAAQGRGAEVHFSGALAQAGTGEWRVGGVSVRLVPDGQAEGPLEPGTVVEVEGTLQPDGVVYARRMAARTFEITGELQGTAGQQWTVAGLAFQVTPQTLLTGIPGLGSQVRVRAVWQADGALLARSVDVLTPGSGPLPGEAEATPQPAETASTVPPTPVVEADEGTATGQATAVEDRISTPEPQETAEATETDQAEGENREGGSSGPAPRQEPTRTSKPEDHGDRTETPGPEETHEPEHTDRPDDPDHSGGSDKTPEPSPKPDDD